MVFNELNFTEAECESELMRDELAIKVNSIMDDLAARAKSVMTKYRRNKKYKQRANIKDAAKLTFS